jgi:hypothetical protein
MTTILKLFISVLTYLLLLVLAFPLMAASEGNGRKFFGAGQQEGRVVLYTFPGQEQVFQEF